MSISQAVQEAIRNNLPGQVADEMRAFIEQAQATERKLERVTEERDTLNRRLSEKEALLAQHGELADRERKVRDREVAAQKLELDNIKAGARMEADVALAELKGVKETQTQFLANVIVRRSVLENGQEVVQGQFQNGYSQMPQTTTVPTYKSTTTTEEQA